MNKPRVILSFSVLLAGSVLTASVYSTTDKHFTVSGAGAIMAGWAIVELWKEMDDGGRPERVHLPLLALTIWWAILTKLFH